MVAKIQKTNGRG